MSVWGMFLALIAMILATLRILANPAGIKYFMATCGKQNCDSVCASFGLQCAGTGQSFPNSSALSIFESLGITCDTEHYTDYYFYKDQPNYISASPRSKNLQWAGRCTGFKAIPSTIDCHTANNSIVRRLCPCHNSSAVLPTQSIATETTHKITKTTSGRIVTSTAQTRALQEHSTGNNAFHRQTKNEDGAYKKALVTVSVILAFVMVTCFVVLLYLLVVRRRKHLSKEKRDAEKSDKGKCQVEYHKTAGNCTSDMMDGLAVVTNDDNSYCDPESTELSIPNPNKMEVKNLTDKTSNNKDMSEKITDNMLYVSGSDGGYTTLSEDHTPPTYEGLV